MKKQIVYINSKTSGKITNENIAGREHIVTRMIPIVGDSVMNNILYPNDEVQSSFNQLDMMKAPIGHPKVNGVNVPVNHPIADNIHNVGAFIRNPIVDGKAIVNELCIDIKRANESDKGKELIEKINSGELIGVSTGLNLQLENSSGQNVDDGKSYDAVGHNFNFDHVAILMNEAAAGEHVGTVIINELSADSLTMQLDVLLEDDRAWIIDLFPDSKTFIYRTEDGIFKRGYSLGANDSVTLLDDTIEVIRKVEFIPKDGNAVINIEDSEMPETPGDSLNGENANAKGEDGQTKELTVNELAEAAIAQGKTIISNEDAQLLANYKTNRSTLDSLVDKENAELEVKRQAVAESMGLNEEEAKELTRTVINTSYDKIVPAQNYQLNGGQPDINNGEKKSFIMNYDDKKGSEANG